MNPEELSRRLLDFAVRIGRVADALPRTSLGRHIAGQLVRCGTSPAPNYEEGCAAESRADFIHIKGGQSPILRSLVIEKSVTVPQ